MSHPNDRYSLAVVIPAYNAETSIRSVILSLPVYVERIIIVDDGSVDQTRKAVQALDDPRIVLLCHERNRGVGGAMVTGFKAALATGIDLVAKIDADGQMEPDYLDKMARLAIEQKYDYVKANRFQKSGPLPEMPPVRLVGNLVLTFLTKMASGFREISDPQNGYVLITRHMLSRLPLDRIDRGYFFENSMLIELNVLGCRVTEMYVPARYGGEISSLRISRIILTFPPKLIAGFVSRMIRKYIIPKRTKPGMG
ncbi:MAG: glycosyltransferase family 2 protein [Syntrophales bacterium]|jgi:glycosyltransferase involved in cell wall biosynthesis|nr:glycosyltransferase family 2 protein [Syntrophales bacterium]MCK9390514.1 glycosyltransferase family 2 protein [Syntrophales bacterium]